MGAGDSRSNRRPSGSPPSQTILCGFISCSRTFAGALHSRQTHHRSAAALETKLPQEEDYPALTGGEPVRRAADMGSRSQL